MKWIKMLFAWLEKISKTNDKPDVVKPYEPLPEIPTKEEVDEFPKTPNKSIDDFKFADISHWEENFDVKKYTPRLLINKCSDGLTYVDKTHYKRQEECRRNGITYGGYHFFQCGKDPILQAQHYLKTHGTFAMNPILDYEKDKDQDESDLIREKENAYIFMCEIERLTGKTPIFYTYTSLLKILKLDPKWKRFILWVARYNSVLGPIPEPFTAEQTFAWQYAEDAPFEGIGECDGNIYYGKINLLNLK